MRAIFVSIVAGILALSMVGTGYATEYPVRWTSEVKLKDLKEIDALLNKPGFAGLGEDYPLTMELGGDQIAAGKVSTQAITRLRIVDNCSPDRFAAIVPATPDEST